MSSSLAFHGRLGACFLACAISSGCVDKLDRPTPPDTTELVQSYAQPTGIVSSTDLVDVLDAIATEGVIETLCGFDPVAEAQCGLTGNCSDCLAAHAFVRGLEALLPSFDTTEDDGDVDGIAGVLGYVEIERICPGFDAPAPLATNGMFTLTVGFDGFGIDPILYGEVIDCQLDLDGVDVILEGDIALVYEEHVPFSQIVSTPVLLSFDGTIDSGGTEIPVRFAYRFRPDGLGSREFLIDVPDNGTFLFIMAPLGLRLEGADGLFSCDVLTMDCEAVSP